jgi:hypothetical protein
MTRREAQAILQLYRPWSVDQTDLEMEAALAHVGQDPELGAWFAAHVAVQAALHDKFTHLPVPEGLKEQIISERKALITTRSRRRLVLCSLAASALVCLVLGLAGLRLRSPTGREFAAFQQRVVGGTVRSYPRMDLETNSLNQIRAYLAAHKALADYVLPEPLNAAAGTGCKVMSWQGKPVSMVCFNSGTTPDPAKPDLYLFVVARSDVSHPPVADSPKLSRVSRLTVASWSRGDLSYVLAGEGDEAFLRKFL